MGFFILLTPSLGIEFHQNLNGKLRNPKSLKFEKSPYSENIEFFPLTLPPCF
jgi:hypothetical protein